MKEQYGVKIELNKELRENEKLKQSQRKILKKSNHHQ
jgi:hypothetical protein